MRDFQHEAQRYMAAHAPVAEGRPPVSYGTQVDSIGSGVRNMSVVEPNGAYPPPGSQAQPQGPVPMSGVLPPHPQASSQQPLLRSNSFQ